ncbi:MAG: isoleucine--tRNA ligase [Sphingobacteriales bacterium SCN 48-20]|uniref:isoleucine--tRNA ligase n=1 Tax=Terrimonas ferruginea TaxID=249 RepID=UPI00086E2FE4|nr:isoleucine--tRNA ligase [Terrimonas ferruginea]MBN8785153.1 isoleucine--tRNA ligase [Terrimonas ferruginea]ODT90839.1 MAG: isoleucine--tRNA ligase [Sphingobacteriales bacterium SCN 48-20]OJW41562.1 MAG: isoleucine--tRNA ligase [Sphingobacteriales bacterium 48-107]
MELKYREFTGLNLPAIEQEVLAAWTAGQAFEKSVSLREGATPFVFYEGPPSANGLPGIHHVISRTLKDLVCRYKTMQGFQVKRKGGWDTHGLPIELGVEKELGITKEDIGKKISVEEYNAKCREAVLRYKDKWDDITRKMGYWVDLNDPYITFKNEYIETLWWLLSELHKKGLLYESVSIQPYSPAAGTGLSSHELNQPGTYKDVKDTSAVAMFRATKDASSAFLFDAAGTDEVFFMAWTTTPWTLPSNLGLTVGPDITYVLVKTINPYTHQTVHVVLAQNLLGKYFKEENKGADFAAYANDGKNIPYTILGSFTGAQLEGLRYDQLLPYEANSPERVREITPDADPFRILLGDFVTTEDGTGIVHTAPAFGADDYRVGKKYNIGILTLVDRQGKFVDGLGEFSNRYVKNYKDEKDYVDVNVDISVKLKKENRAFKVEKYEHSYPHCWRTDKPVLYYPLDAWFIRTTALRDRMVELNKTINWKPKSTGDGRFGNWLENMVDWNLSRSRFWGTPLPIWKSVGSDNLFIDEREGGEEICIGSIEELNNEIRRAAEVLGGDTNKAFLENGIQDLHKPYVDDIILVSPSGKPMRRVPDLIDVWFDSGAMPYAQWHFPFENKETFKQAFPADFIAEGVDQTRGWFYTLHAIACLLFDSVAYKTVVSNGLVLDKNGNKMSKRLGNVVDPFDTIERFGADATRWYLITNASPWDNLKFDLEGIREVQRKFFGTLYNTYQFFALYANVDGFAFREAYIQMQDRPEIDRWILSSLHTLTQKVTAAMDDYEPTQAGRLIEDFVDEHLSNWYVRLCRRRFWKGEYEHDKICAYQTLYECLETVVRLMAPVAPFFSDSLFRQLNAVTNRFTVESVHHAYFPKADESLIDRSLEERMQMAQDASSLILSLRKKVNIKVRQPLQRVLIPVLDAGMKDQLALIEDLIRSEVNVKEIEYLTETEGFIKKKIKPNFIALGKRLGARMKAVSAALAQFSQEDISRFEKEGQYSLLIDSEPVILQISEVDITSEDIPGWTVAGKGRLTVALDITITPELEQEGNAREFVNRIQKIRKDSGFELTDRIVVKVVAEGSLKTSLEAFRDYISAEILADELEFVSDISGGTDIEINDIVLKTIVLKKG